MSEEARRLVGEAIDEAMAEDVDPEKPLDKKVDGVILFDIPGVFEIKILLVFIFAGQMFSIVWEIMK